MDKKRLNAEEALQVMNRAQMEEWNEMSGKERSAEIQRILGSR